MGRIRWWLFIAVMYTDIFMLNTTSKVLAFLNDWLSIRQVTIEWSLLATYGAFGIGWAVSMGWGTWWALPLTILLCFIVGIQSKQLSKRLFTGDKERFRDLVMFGPMDASYRVSILLIGTVFGVLFLRLPGIHSGVFWASHQYSQMLFLYVTAFPRNGTPGRKRREALNKLKQSLKVSIPQPQAG